MKYSPDTKAEALARINQVGVQKASEEMNISIQTLYKWRNEQKDNGVAAVPTDVEMDELRQAIITDKFLEEKLSRMQTENEALREENEALREKVAKMRKAIIALIG